VQLKGYDAKTNKNCLKEKGKNAAVSIFSEHAAAITWPAVITVIALGGWAPVNDGLVQKPLLYYHR
jgi:hypothetical protein